MGDNIADTLLGALGNCPPDADRLRGAAVEGEPRLLIGGELVESASGQRFPNIDPATGEVLGETANATIADAERAIEAARRAFDETDWSRDAAFRRHCLEQLQAALRKHADEFRVALVHELGCPIRMTYGDQYDYAVEKLGFYANMTTEYGYTKTMPEQPLGPFTNQRSIFYDPVGVVGAIVPWNLPVELELAKIGAALGSGNSVVLKSAPDTPWSGTILGRLIKEETEMPPGVCNVLASTDHEGRMRRARCPRVAAGPLRRSLRPWNFHGTADQRRSHEPCRAVRGQGPRGGRARGYRRPETVGI